MFTLKNLKKVALLVAFFICIELTIYSLFQIVLNFLEDNSLLRYLIYLSTIFCSFAIGKIISKNI